MSSVRIPLGVTSQLILTGELLLAPWSIFFCRYVVVVHQWLVSTVVVEWREETLCCSPPLITPSNLIHSFSLHTLWLTPHTPAKRCDSLSHPIHQSPCNCVTHAICLYSTVSPCHSWAVLNAFCLFLLLFLLYLCHFPSKATLPVPPVFFFSFSLVILHCQNGQRA